MLPERFWFHLRQIVIALLQLFVEKAVDKRPLRVRQLLVCVPRLPDILGCLGRDVVRIELFDLFFEYLLSQNVSEYHILKIELDQRRYYKFRNPITLCEYVESTVRDRKDKKFYLFIDEVQLTTKVVDKENGGMLYYTDVYNKPVQEYWHNMKFWWPHDEALIAMTLAYKLTGEERYAIRHDMVRNWAFSHFQDVQHGDWFGYLNKDGSRANTLKGSLWKSFFHHPRAMWCCAHYCGAI